MTKIMVQDEDQEVRDMLTAALTMHDYQVIPVEHCNAQLVQQVGYLYPDAVVLDFRVSGRDCVETFTKLKSRFPSIPVMVLSCHPHIEDLQAEFNFDAVLHKPFDLDELYGTVEKLLQG